MLGPDVGKYILVSTTKTDENIMVKTPRTINGGFHMKSDDLPVQHPAIVIQVDDIGVSIL